MQTNLAGLRSPSATPPLFLVASMPQSAEVAAWLTDRQVEVRWFEDPTPTAESAARAVGCSPAEIAKSILFILAGRPVLVVTSGDTKVASGLLKQAMGLAGKVRLPAAEEVEEATGYSPGGVCPFLLPEDLAVLLDNSLWRFSIVYPAAGDDHSAVPLPPDRLLALTGGRKVEVCVPLAVRQT
jgi:prolyl-tRNA editing enzyme YbaK/EbsC (Cys-tRNA(Pro) deacylase)